MNRTRMVVLAFISLSLSVVVAFAAYRMLESRMNPVARTGRVVVSTKKLSLGARITAEDLRVVDWPASAPLEGGFGDPKIVVGRGVLVPLVPNEPVLESKLAPKDAGFGLSSVIPDGMRAVAVKVNEVIGVAGFVLPGSRVDVILTGSPTERNATDTSKVILENVQVLAAGTHLEPDARGTPQDVAVVTLLVAPQDAQKLALASADGRIQLALRNPLDLQHRDPVAVKKAALYVGSAVPSPLPTRVARKVDPPAPVKTDLSIELIQGSKRETWRFEQVANDETHFERVASDETKKKEEKQ